MVMRCHHMDIQYTDPDIYTLNPVSMYVHVSRGGVNSDLTQFQFCHKSMYSRYKSQHTPYFEEPQMRLFCTEYAEASNTNLRTLCGWPITGLYLDIQVMVLID